MSAEELQNSKVQAEGIAYDTCFEFIESNDTRVRRTDTPNRRIPFFDHNKVITSYEEASALATKRIHHQFGGINGVVEAFTSF